MRHRPDAAASAWCAWPARSQRPSPGGCCVFAAGRALEAGRAHFGELVEIESGERIDEVVATWFAAPHSYTTDEMVEISCHGSPVVLRRVVEMAIAQGARLAEPGEFTQRAFLNGRLDLTQAEAVRDLIDSQTLYQAKVAARQLKGSLSRVLLPVKEKLVALIARLEAGIDFAEDDVAVMPADQDSGGDGRGEYAAAWPGGELRFWQGWCTRD